MSGLLRAFDTLGPLLDTFLWRNSGIMDNLEATTFRTIIDSLRAVTSLSIDSRTLLTSPTAGLKLTLSPNLKLLQLDCSVGFCQATIQEWVLLLAAVPGQARPFLVLWMESKGTPSERRDLSRYAGVHGVNLVIVDQLGTDGVALHSDVQGLRANTLQSTYPFSVVSSQIPSRTSWCTESLASLVPSLTLLHRSTSRQVSPRTNQASRSSIPGGFTRLFLGIH